MTRVVLSLLIGIMVGLGGYHVYSEASKPDMAFVINQQIKLREQAFRDLLAMTENNEAKPVANKIIDPCGSTEQLRFDWLLNNLPTLSENELQEAKRALKTCGDVIASRKAYMVAELENELFQLEQLHALLFAWIEDESITNNLNVYRDLVRLESERASSLTQFVNLQEQIIDNLIKGLSASDHQMVELTNKVQEEYDTYSVLKTQIKTAKEQL